MAKQTNTKQINDPVAEPKKDVNVDTTSAVDTKIDVDSTPIEDPSVNVDTTSAVDTDITTPITKQTQELPDKVVDVIKKFINSHSSSLHIAHVSRIGSEHITIDMAKELYKNLVAFYPSERAGIICVNTLREYFKAHDKEFFENHTAELNRNSQFVHID